MIILRQKEFVQATTLSVPQSTIPVQTTVRRNQTPRILRKARVSAYKTGKALNNAAWNLELNPQETVKQGIKGGTEFAARYPLVATGKTLGIPISSAVGYAIAGTDGVIIANTSPVGVGTAMATLDPILHKSLPRYDRATNRAAEAVKNSKGFNQALDSIVGRDPQVTFRNSGPNAPFSEKLKYNIHSGVADISKGIQGTGKSVMKFLKRFSEEEKEFSYKSAKRAIEFRAGLKGVGNKLITTLDNAGLRAGNTIREIATGKPTPHYMKVGFRPKTREQLKSEALREAKSVKSVVNEAKTNPEGLTGRLTKKAADEVTKSPLSFAGKIAIDSKLPGTPTTTPYLMVSPIEQKVWDRVNQVGVGNYTLGRVTSPVKRTIRNVAEPLGRTLYRQGTML